MFKNKYFVILLFCYNFLFSQFGKDGLYVVNSGSVILNQYSLVVSNISANQNFVVVSNISELNSISVLSCGDLIMVYQAQGVEMNVTDTPNYGSMTNFNSAGFFEYRHVLSVSGNTITLDNALNNNYSINGHIQAIRIPQYTKLRINAGAILSGMNWNGIKGGIVSIHCSDSLIVNGTIKADGIGFRGGLINSPSNVMYFANAYVSTVLGSGGAKGEGVCGNQTEYLSNGGNLSRGAPGNGGGGATAVNSGGGGGANAFNGSIYNGAGVMCNSCTGNLAWTMDADYLANSNSLTNSSGGGRGGNSGGAYDGNALINAPGSSSWGSDNWRNVGGRGGRPLANINSTQRVYFGGGGGAGDANNNSGTSGGNGGGLIYLISPEITGTGTVSSNGNNSLDSHLTHDDGQGGGGAGGSIVLNCNNSSSILTTANGGVGGSIIANTTYVTGPGGGGGGGYISKPIGSPTLSFVNGGQSGVSLFSWVSEFPVNGATNGSTGLVESVPVFTIVSNYFSGSNNSIAILSVSNNTICLGSNAVIVPSGSSSYSISPLNLTGTSFTVNPSTTTTYTISGMSGQCQLTPTTVTIYIGISPTLSINSPSVCSNQSSTLTVTGASTYTWLPQNSIGSTQIVNLIAPTVYTVIGAGANTCTNSIIQTIGINPTSTITSVSCNNTTCGLSNGSATVTSMPSSNTYSWSSGLASITGTINAVAAGNYSVTVYNGTCQTNTVVTILSSVSLQIVSNTITGSDCGVSNGSILVTDNLVNSSYSWTPNVSSSNSLSNLSPGTYSLLITNGICTTSTVYIVPQLNGPSEINVILNDAICESLSGGISVTSVSNGVAPYQFSFNNLGYSSVSTFSNLAQGIYTITVKDINGCIYSDTFIVNKDSVNSTIDLITNSPSCNSNDGSFVINSISGGREPFSLNFNGLSYSTDTIFEKLASGNYVLVIKDSNLCETSLILNMPFDKNDYTLYVPNTFTPNRDIINEFWFVKGTCINSFNCLIFNRWGEKIIELVNLSEKWDGTFKGKDVPDGVYVYLIEAETNNGTIYKNGHINLFR